MTAGSDNLTACETWTVTRFRYHSALALTAVLATLAATSLLYEGTLAIGEIAEGARGTLVVLKSLLVLVPLIPLAVAVWAWRAGTDANEYGIRVRALLGRKVVPWTEVTALVPDHRGRALATLRNGHALHLTAVRAADLPRLVQASGKPMATTPSA
jgi:Bacterial PH domain